jgi:uncharacterized membrane protein (DUF485 family)
MTDDSNGQTLQRIHARSRRRAWYSVFILSSYALFLLPYTAAGAFLQQPLFDGTRFTGVMLLFCSLVVVFLVLELVYLLQRDREDAHG